MRYPVTVATAPRTMLPLVALSTDSLADAFARRLALVTPTAGTGKRKVDGSKAATRLGSTVTEAWCNERFRQVVLLVREFRMEWPTRCPDHAPRRPLPPPGVRGPLHLAQARLRTTTTTNCYYCYHHYYCYDYYYH